MAHHHTRVLTLAKRAGLVVPTRDDQWVIPYDCEVLKALLVHQNIHANDLRFDSLGQCQSFIKELLLLAAQDECRHCSPSTIAELARELIVENSNSGAAN